MGDFLLILGLLLLRCFEVGQGVQQLYRPRLQYLLLHKGVFLLYLLLMLRLHVLQLLGVLLQLLVLKV